MPIGNRENQEKEQLHNVSSSTKQKPITNNFDHRKIKKKRSLSKVRDRVRERGCW
jgi:hypothetical protein